MVGAEKRPILSFLMSMARYFFFQVISKKPFKDLNLESQITNIIEIAGFNTVKGSVSVRVSGRLGSTSNT